MGLSLNKILTDTLGLLDTDDWSSGAFIPFEQYDNFAAPAYVCWSLVTIQLDDYGSVTNEVAAKMQLILNCYLLGITDLASEVSTAIDSILDTFNCANTAFLAVLGANDIHKTIITQVATSGGLYMAGNREIIQFTFEFSKNQIAN